jgi:hypothetical protein
LIEHDIRFKKLVLVTRKFDITGDVFCLILHCLGVTSLFLLRDQ